MSIPAQFARPSASLSPRAATAFAFLTAVSFSAATSAPTPLYHVYQQAMALSPLTITLVFASYAFAMLASFLTVARLSDFVGRKPMILVSLLINALSLLIFITAASAGQLILARVVQGIGNGIAMTTLGAAILDTDAKNGPLYNSVTAFLGLMVGSLLAGALVAFAPLPTQLVYVVLLAVTLLEAAVLVVVPETTARHPGALRVLIPHAVVPTAARPAMLRLLPLNTAGWALGGFYFSLMPTLVGVATHIDSPFIGGAVVSAMMLAAAVVVFALRHLPAERLISTGMGGLALGIVLTLVGIAVSSAPVMILGTVIVGGGFGSAFAGMLRRLLPLAGPSERAGLLAAFFVASYLAFALPAIAAGLVAPVLGLVTTTYLYQGVLLGLVAASFVAMRPAKVHHLLEV